MAKAPLPVRYIALFLLVSDIIGLILRYFNVFGPRQPASSPYSGVISIFMDRITKGKPVTIYGDGEQTRDFVYVKDVVQANLLAMYGKHKGFPALNVAICAEMGFKERITRHG